MRTLLALLLALGLVTGCSGTDDCSGRAYHEDLDQAGEKTPIRVSTVRTRAGGYVVNEAADDATGCGDELS